MEKQTTNQIQSELEAIINWFGSDEVDIDEAEAKYKRGLELARELKKRLQATENAINKLKEDFGS